MTTFEDRLWAELVEYEGSEFGQFQSDPPTRRQQGVVVGVLGAAMAAAVGTTAALTIGAVSSPPAFAVTQNPDGTLTIQINELTGVTGANAQLAVLGVRAEAIVLDPSCTSAVRSIPYPNLRGAILAPSDLTVGVTIHPDAIPVGDTLLLRSQAGHKGSGCRACDAGPRSGTELCRWISH